MLRKKNSHGAMTHRHAAHGGTLRHWIMYDDVQTTCPESLKSTYVYSDFTI